MPEKDKFLSLVLALTDKIVALKQQQDATNERVDTLEIELEKLKKNSKR